MVGEAVHLFVAFIATFAGEDFQVFECRCVDWAEAIGAVNPLGGGDEPFARDHLLRQIVAETLEGAGGDHGKVELSVVSGPRSVESTSPQATKFVQRLSGRRVAKPAVIEQFECCTDSRANTVLFVVSLW